ncbi:MAG: hypothetical protein LBR57_01425 [Alistipes sp.]|jgi:hypothetical protein|nr:hypothetical protein [Alistipes sp.]
MTRTIIISVIAAVFACGCGKQRDLYELQPTTLHVVGVLNVALGGNPTMDATIHLYGNGSVVKEFYSRPNGGTLHLLPGHYDAMVFNGVMESEQVTNLDGIYMRGTGSPATFEVCCAPANPLRNIPCLDGEYIAGNNMSLFAFDMKEVDIKRTDGLRLKYIDGGRVREVDGDTSPIPNNVYVEFTPRACSFRFRVRMTGLVNPRSAAYVSGAVRGLMGSIFPATENGVPRGGFAATHHLALFPCSGGEKIRIAEDGTEIGTAESSVFVTFGPVIPAPGERLADKGLYFFDPVITLVDGTEFRLPSPLDITPQVNAIAATISAHHSTAERITHDNNLFTIEIPDSVLLPVVDEVDPGDGPLVDVTDWGRDEPVIIWI